MRICLLIIWLIIPCVVSAQSVYLSIGPTVLLPNNNLKLLGGPGFGGSVALERLLTYRLSLTGTIHLDAFQKKEYRTPPPTTSVIFKMSIRSLGVGGRFYLTKKEKEVSGLFVSGEIGWTALALRVKVDNTTDNTKEDDFSYAPGLGYRYRNFELNYWQQFVVSSQNSGSFTGFRLAYVFPVR